MCFEKKLVPNKQIYTKEIRRYISERKEVKKKLSEKVISPNFTFDKIKFAVQELKGGQCSQ